MTAKQKARQIIGRFKVFQEARFTDEGRLEEFAKIKVISLKAVDVLITEERARPAPFRMPDRIKFWKQVKEHIIKIERYTMKSIFLLAVLAIASCQTKPKKPSPVIGISMGAYKYPTGEKMGDTFMDSVALFIGYNNKYTEHYIAEMKAQVNFLVNDNNPRYEKEFYRHQTLRIRYADSAAMFYKALTQIKLQDQ